MGSILFLASGSSQSGGKRLMWVLCAMPERGTQEAMGAKGGTDGGFSGGLPAGTEVWVTWVQQV